MKGVVIKGVLYKVPATLYRKVGYVQKECEKSHSPTINNYVIHTYYYIT